MTSETHEDTQIPVVWPLEIDLPSLPANNFAIGKAGDFVYVTFGELRPLIARNVSEEKAEQLRESGIAIKPLASVVLAADGHKVLTHLLVSALETDDLEELAVHIQKTLQERQEQEP